MADHIAVRIQELEESRRKNLREVSRARKRRRTALRKRQWETARNALKVARRHTKDAQEDLAKIRILRANRKKANAAARLLRHRRKAGRHYDGRQLYWFDGKKVTDAAYKRLAWARKHGWKGYLTSGIRDPYYSEQLCYAMCGRPSCSGRCAGRSSNHVRDAIDVTDYYTFAQKMRECPYTPHWFNALPNDRVHFSPNGH